jgi:hypothetical protein
MIQVLPYYAAVTPAKAILFSIPPTSTTEHIYNDTLYMDYLVDNSCIVTVYGQIEGSVWLCGGGGGGAGAYSNRSGGGGAGAFSALFSGLIESGAITIGAAGVGGQAVATYASRRGGAGGQTKYVMQSRTLSANGGGASGGSDGSINNTGGNGGSGGGSGCYINDTDKQYPGAGNASVTKIPFGDSDNYTPWCAGGGGGGLYYLIYLGKGGNGGSNGSAGGAWTGSATTTANKGLGGDIGGGDGANVNTKSSSASMLAAQTGSTYGSGGGGGASAGSLSDAARMPGAAGMRGCVIIRIPVHHDNGNVYII